MKKNLPYIKLLLTLTSMLVLNAGFGSFIGSRHAIDDDDKFSLKNLSKYKKNYSLSSIRLSQFQFMGSQDIFQQKTNNSVQMQSMLRLQKGNTTYIYPYKHTVKIPKFKTPTPSPFH